jgi:hypothetical protein
MTSPFETREYADRAEAARTAAEAAIARTPRATSFGYFAYGDACGAIGGGVGLFQWFPSRTALLEHLAQHLTFENPGQHGTDPFAVQAAVQKAIASFAKTDAPLKNLIRKLNPLLKTYSQLTWIGTLGELKEGLGKYEKGVRRTFREDNDAPRNQSRPIERSEAAAFIDFLSQYGI